MKLLVLFGLIAGATLALGRLSAAQWHALGAALLALALAHGLTVLPWLLAALLAWAWRREKRRAWLYEQIAVSEQEERRQRGAQIWDLERAAEKRLGQRKRARR